MSSGESDFLKGLMIQYREIIFKDPVYQDNSLESILTKNVQSAVKEGIISKKTVQQMFDSLSALKKRSIKELSPKEQQSVLQVFQRAIADQSDVESGYEGSGISSAEVYSEAKLTPPDVVQILERQREFQKSLKSAVAKKQLINILGEPVSAKKQSDGSYRLKLQPVAAMQELQPEDVGKTVGGELKMPDIFKVDHWDRQRGQYISVTFSQHQKKIVVNTQEQAQELMAYAKRLADSVVSDPEKGKLLSYAILLFTTQHTQNWLLTPMIEVLRSGETRGYEDFNIKIVEMKLHFESVTSGSRQQGRQRKKENQFQVKVEAKIQTMHKALGELDPAVAEARAHLGIQPVAEGVVQGRFVCVMDPRSEQFEIQDLKADYFLRI